MSINGAMDIYQKMLEKAENRKSSSGMIKQPTPYDSGQISNPVAEAGEELNPEEEMYLADIDKRMAARAAGNPITESSGTNDVSRIVKLEKEVESLKELMTEMMKTHMKLLRENK